MNSKTITLTLEYDGELNLDLLEDYLETGLDNYIRAHYSTIKYSNHTFYCEGETIG